MVAIIDYLIPCSQAPHQVLEGAMNIIYFRVVETYEKWSLRTLRGYYKCLDQIRKTFQESYLL